MVNLFTAEFLGLCHKLTFLFDYIIFGCQCFVCICGMVGGFDKFVRLNVTYDILGVPNSRHSDTFRYAGGPIYRAVVFTQLGCDIYLIINPRQ